jgi:hypothetical protein
MRRQPREQQPNGRRHTDPGHEAADRHERRHRAPDLGSNLGDGQAQAGLEQDHADGHRHERLVEVAEQPVGMDVVGHHAGHDADRQQQHDRRQPEPARHELRADREDQHQAKTGEDVVRRRRGHATVVGAASARAGGSDRA